ncbi:MAG TPA: hypothetical protein VGS22_01635 [Thermoanaerobaculia bacterium]|jgi:hypothetical protein|nr:hypothetical protein [Thermoanaerobaculia bacterium]
MRFLLVILGALFLTCLPAAAFDPFVGPAPIAIFIQTDPWSMVIGSDTPRVAVYENGEVIFVKKVGGDLAYHHVRLAKEALEKLRGEIKPLLAVKNLEPWYNLAPNITDQPQSMFYLRDGDREVATCVYGLMAAGTKLPAYTQFPGGPKATAPPDALLKLHERLCHLDFPASIEWRPDYLEVMLWDYSYAPESSIHWPKEWPSLDSERALKRGDSYSVFLDGSLLPKLREFLSTRNEKGAVEVAGKKLAASYRFVFPSEPVWSKAFADAARRASAKGSE